VTFNADDVLWMPTTWAVFFLVNHLLIVGVSADTSMTFKEALREDLSYYILTLFAVLSLAPIIALVAVTVWPMLFLFLVPLWAVNKAASISQERDYASRHDMLTELPNRTMMRDELTEAIDLASRTGARVGVLLMDLNLFKEVNDTYGHAVGDRLLTMVAGRIKAQVRPGDLAARLGGDEFAVVLPGVEDHISAVRIAQRIRESISRPFTMDDVTVTIDVSIGIALYPDDGTQIDPLIQAADSAMYVAKRTGTRIEVVGIDRGEAHG
jgi:diguanylate cyclase (GGDEF)-like protein